MTNTEMVLAVCIGFLAAWNLFLHGRVNLLGWFAVTTAKTILKMQGVDPDKGDKES